MSNIEFFNLEKQYSLYLEGMSLKESDMHPQEAIERKRAFMAGVYQILTTMKIVFSELTEEEGVVALERMLVQSENIIRSIGNENVN